MAQRARDVAVIGMVLVGAAAGTVVGVRGWSEAGQAPSECVRPLTGAVEQSALTRVALTYAGDNDGTAYPDLLHGQDTVERRAVSEAGAPVPVLDLTWSRVPVRDEVLAVYGRGELFGPDGSLVVDLDEAARAAWESDVVRAQAAAQIAAEATSRPQGWPAIAGRHNETAVMQLALWSLGSAAVIEAGSVADPGMLGDVQAVLDVAAAAADPGMAAEPIMRARAREGDGDVVHIQVSIDGPTVEGDDVVSVEFAGTRIFTNVPDGGAACLALPGDVMGTNRQVLVRWERRVPAGTIVVSTGAPRESDGLGTAGLDPLGSGDRFEVPWYTGITTRDFRAVEELVVAIEPGPA